MCVKVLENSTSEEDLKNRRPASSNTSSALSPKQLLPFFRNSNSSCHDMGLKCHVHLSFKALYRKMSFSQSRNAVHTRHGSFEIAYSAVLDWCGSFAETSEMLIGRRKHQST